MLNEMTRAGRLLIVLGLAAGLCAAASAAEETADAQSPAAVEEGFRSLFDGESLEGWDGDPQFWKVEGGAIVGRTTRDNPAPHNTFLVWRGGEPADFELKLQYRLTGGNSGIQYRSFELPSGKWRIGGYQADFDAADGYTGIVYGEQFRGILCPRGKKVVVGNDHRPQVVGEVGQDADYKDLFRKEDWNDYHIVVRGHRHVLSINGATTAELTDEDADTRRAKGLIAFQVHAGPPMKVEFRNVRLKVLDESTSNR